MPPARYGRPPGFGGGYDSVHRGIFQPGTEVGVIDPNVGRFWSIACTWSLTANAVQSAVDMSVHAARSAISLAGHSVRSEVHHFPERE